MKLRFILHGGLQTVALLLVLCIGQVALADESWTLAKDADGIRVYTRSVANSPLRKFRGEVELAVKGERVVTALKDVNSYRKWMPDVIVSTLLSSTENEQYYYLEYATPWPVSNRDGVYRHFYSRAGDSGAGAMLVRVTAAPDHLPKREGKVRVPKSDGFWKIAPKGNGVTVTWQMHAEPGGSIPGWLANATVVDTPFKMLRNLRSYLQSKAP